MSAPFTINIDSLTNLDPSRAVEFFRRLLWAEATKVGIGINLIDVPNNIYVSDGGIDAFIEDANHIDDELIPKGTTGFQIKSGKDSGDEGFKRELHVKNNLDLPLKPEINRILNNGGGYVLVLFDELTTEKKLDRRKAIRNEIKRMGFKNPSVRVYSANQIQGYAEKYIALILWLSGSFNTAYPYSSWSKFRSITGLKNFVPDEPRKAIIELIKDKIRNDENVCRRMNPDKFRLIAKIHFS
ncbi:MAG: hypothetical protein IIB40_12065 [Candidatus Marinimicrobia bacterium]|nr:hypothetical protein [Candidatus Neomarinimicrobiota bacterium]